MAAIEALAAERPVVATRVGGVPRGRRRRRGRLLAAERRRRRRSRTASPSSPATPGLRERLGRHGAERMRERYSAGRMVDEIDALYERLLAR